jgi:hypothetical protein
MPGPALQETKTQGSVTRAEATTFQSPASLATALVICKQLGCRVSSWLQMVGRIPWTSGPHRCAQWGGLGGEGEPHPTSAAQRAWELQAVRASWQFLPLPGSVCVHSVTRSRPGVAATSH